MQASSRWGSRVKGQGFRPRRETPRGRPRWEQTLHLPKETQTQTQGQTVKFTCVRMCVRMCVYR